MFLALSEYMYMCIQNSIRGGLDRDPAASRVTERKYKHQHLAFALLDYLYTILVFVCGGAGGGGRCTERDVGDTLCDRAFAVF